MSDPVRQRFAEPVAQGGVRGALRLFSPLDCNFIGFSFGFQELVQEGPTLAGP
jgi:hypothetical protein